MGAFARYRCVAAVALLACGDSPGNSNPPPTSPPASSTPSGSPGSGGEFPYQHSPVPAVLSWAVPIVNAFAVVAGSRADVLVAGQTNGGGLVVRLGVGGTVEMSRVYGVDCGVSVWPVELEPDGHAILQVAKSCDADVPGLGTGWLSMYAAYRSGESAGALIEVDEQGEYVQTLTTSGVDAGMGSMVTAASDGTFFVGTGEHVNKLSHEGRELWSAPILVLAGPHLGPMPDGGVVVHDYVDWRQNELKLVRLGPDGARLWTILVGGLEPTGTSVDGNQLATTPEGVVIVADTRNPAGNVQLQMFSPDGTSLESIDTGVPQIRRIEAVPGGQVLLTFDSPPAAKASSSYDPRQCLQLRLFSADLAPLWEYAIDPTCNALLEDIKMTGPTQAVLVGQLFGPATFGDGQVITPTVPGSGFVIGIQW